MIELNYTITKKLTEENITDLIIDAVECGINYWALICNNTKLFDEYYKKFPTDATSEIIAKILLDGGKVKIKSAEDNAEPKHYLTLNRLLKGIQKNADQRPWDCDLDNYDAVTTDCIIQYAIFDELIFG